MICAQTEVPNEALLDISFAKYQLQEGGMSINVPPQVLSAAGLRENNNNNQRPKASNRQSNNGNRSANNNPRQDRNNGNNANSTTAYHRNMPRGLKVTNGTFSKYIGPAIFEGAVKVPKMKGKSGKNTDTCVKYALRGHCTNECYLADSHVEVQPGRRLNELVDLRRQLEAHCNERKGPNDPDFQ
jgi:hypothetical protein